MERIFNTVLELENFAKELVEFALKNRDESKAFFVRLRGELGAGKTTLSKAVGKYLGVEENIQSPTFVLQKFYKTKHDIFSELVHIDAYRIDDIKEAKILNIEEIAKKSNTLVLIEWPEKIESSIPKVGVEVLLEHVGESQRKLTLKLL